MLGTVEQYLGRLRAHPCRIFYEGQRIEDVTSHPLLRPTIDNIAETYRLAHEAGEAALFTDTSHLTGRPVSRYTHIPRSPEHMAQRIRMERRVANLTGMSNYRSTGADALICLESITHEIDQEKGSDYHGRFNRFLRGVQEEDLVVGGAMTDTKGDRNLRPSAQRNPDVYLHVVAEKDDGVVVRGAKNCQSGAGVFDELIVLPTRSMTAADRDYAIAFAIPNSAPGLLHILSRQPGLAACTSGGPIDNGTRYAGHETLMVFDDVFVPWERVFLYREWEAVGRAVERFASFHRVCYAGAVVGFLDVVIGAAALQKKT